MTEYAGLPCHLKSAAVSVLKQGLPEGLFALSGTPLSSKAFAEALLASFALCLHLHPAGPVPAHISQPL